MQAFAELSSLPVVDHRDGSFTITKKFLSGMNNYAARWPGPVTAFMNPSPVETDNLDNIRVRPGDIDFAIAAVDFRSDALRDRLSKCGFVHWGPHHETHDLAGVLKSRGIPNVYSTEYSLTTRRQIIAANTRNPLLRWRRYLWEQGQERRIRKNIAEATGLEANGTPTYEAYSGLNPRNLLFFASWARAESLISAAKLAERLRHSAREDARLRLVFSGRLNEMKGAMDLIEVAAALRRRGLDFHLSICGGGVLEGAMRARIVAEGLQGHVVMRGVLSYEDELIPFIKQSCDLFLCCHRQGDPSSTYLETFACGVPIAGYGNEAFSGILRRSGAGWVAAVGDAEGLARAVIAIDGDRGDLAAKSRAALAFAEQHTFEQTFARRVAFFEEIAGQRTADARSAGQAPGAASSPAPSPEATRP